MSKESKISKEKINGIMNKLKNGEAYLFGGYVTDQSWSVRYENGKFIERIWDITRYSELELSEGEVEEKLRFYGERIVKQN